MMQDLLAQGTINTDILTSSGRQSDSPFININPICRIERT